MHRKTDFAPSIGTILREPEGTYIPQGVAPRYFTAVRLIEVADAENFNAIVTYVLRPEFSAEYSLMVVTEICKRDPKLFCNSPAFVRWAKENKHLAL